MRIAIFGSGGVGGYFGGRLAEAGVEVMFIARGRHLAAIQTRGLKVDSIEGNFHLARVLATDKPSALKDVDAVLVAVKTWQVAEVGQAIAAHCGPQTVIVPLQNGVEASSQLAEMVGKKRVIGGVCGLISYIALPGYIRHSGGMPFIKFGELDGHTSERVVKLYRLFRQAKGMNAELAADIQQAIWQKFLLITSFSGVGAVTRSPIGMLRSLPETRELLVQAMQEIIDLATAKGIALPADSLEQTLDFFDKLPEDATSSMQRDLMAGRPSELEAQNGAVLRLAREAGVATPLHQFIYASLLPLEKQARAKSLA
jgi:2-dehydropantoate 2-reductase